MTKNLQLLIDNLHDGATLTATSEALAISYTQDQRRDYVWESDDLADQVITGLLDQAHYADVFAISRYNFTAAATVKLVLYNSGTEVYNSGAEPVAQFIPAGIWRAGIDGWMATYNDLLPAQMLVIDIPLVIFDRYEITLSDPANPDGFLHVSRIAIGQLYEAEVNFSNGAQIEWIENIEHTRMSGGGLYSSGDIGSRARRLKVDLDWLNQTERLDLDVRLTGAGQGRDMLVRAYPESGGAYELIHTFFAKRTSALSFTHSYHDNFNLPLVLEEC